MLCEASRFLAMPMERQVRVSNWSQTYLRRRSTRVDMRELRREPNGLHLLGDVGRETT